MKLRFVRSLVVFACLAASACGADSSLRLVVILGRHGVRSPREPNSHFNEYSAQPWPSWEVPPGWLTPHGERQMSLLGRYYRERYLADGLLSGGPDDAGRVAVRSDWADERTVVSAQRLATALLGGAQPTMLNGTRSNMDPLFSPVRIELGHPDHEVARAAVLGRIGNDPRGLTESYRPQLELLQRILFGSRIVPPGKIGVFSSPAGIGSGSNFGASIVSLTGALNQSTIVDSLVLEYVDGMPMSEVGWGRLTPDGLNQLLPLLALNFELTQGTLYPAQAQGSNLALHIGETIDQAIAGRRVAGAIGAPGDRIVVLLGHDTNIANLGGLLHLSWIIPGSPPNPLLPGGAMVIELRGRAGGDWRVRFQYVTQSLEQIRDETPLSLEHPPVVAPIFVPGCSEASPGYDAPWAKVKAALNRAIDPRFTLPGANDPGT